VSTWLERYQEILGERYDRLDEYLRELQGGKSADKREGKKDR
jgi:hypothetical protein